MSDERTPEQRAADDELLAAIEKVVNLQDRDDDEDMGDVVVAEFVVVARTDNFVLMESGRSGYAYITKDSGHGPQAQSAHSCVGLTELGKRWWLE